MGTSVYCVLFSFAHLFLPDDCVLNNTPYARTRQASQEGLELGVGETAKEEVARILGWMSGLSQQC